MFFSSLCNISLGSVNHDLCDVLTSEYIKLQSSAALSLTDYRRLLLFEHKSQAAR